MDRSIDERLAGCALVRTRFGGRADLTRAAQTDLAALRGLEEILGLPVPALPLAHELWLARPDSRALGRRIAAYLHSAQLTDSRPGPRRACALGTHSHAIDRVRRIRSADREGIPAPVAGRIGALQTERRRLVAQAIVLPVVAQAGLRTATHSHSECVVLCAPGEEHAHSTSGSIWASEAGLPQAYCRQAYRVATSDHTWCVSDPSAVRVVGEHVYLSATRRVRQGRGTSLVTEALVAGARGALTWRAL